MIRQGSGVGSVKYAFFTDKSKYHQKQNLKCGNLTEKSEKQIVERELNDE